MNTARSANAEQRPAAVQRATRPSAGAAAARPRTAAAPASISAIWTSGRRARGAGRRAAANDATRDADRDAARERPAPPRRPATGIVIVRRRERPRANRVGQRRTRRTAVSGCRRGAGRTGRPRRAAAAASRARTTISVVGSALRTVALRPGRHVAPGRSAAAGRRRVAACVERLAVGVGGGWQRLAAAVAAAACRRRRPPPPPVPPPPPLLPLLPAWLSSARAARPGSRSTDRCRPGCCCGRRGSGATCSRRSARRRPGSPGGSSCVCCRRAPRARPRGRASRHATRAVRSIGKATLAAVLGASGACGGQRAAHAGGPRGVGVARDGVASRGAQTGPQRGVVVQAAQRARRARPRRPAGTIRPVRSCSIRPPAAAPTASVAITGTPWLKASLTTSPHGSQEVARGDATV